MWVSVSVSVPWNLSFTVARQASFDGKYVVLQATWDDGPALISVSVAVSRQPDRHQLMLRDHGGHGASAWRGRVSVVRCRH